MWHGQHPAVCQAKRIDAEVVTFDIKFANRPGVSLLAVELGD